MNDARFYALLGTVFFIAGNTDGSKRMRVFWYVAAFVYWIAATSSHFAPSN